MYDSTKPYISEIKRLIQTTWNTKYLQVNTYGVRRKPGAPQGMEWRHTDGIGTKGKDHWRKRSFAAAVQDALAMNLNDFARDRCIPFEICDHIFLPVDDHEAMISIVSHMADLCRVHHLAITGGEPAIHEGSQGLEISITMLGVRRSFELNTYHENDILIGIGSSGAHSNGFTKIHQMFDDVQSLPDDIITPTLIYYNCIEEIDRIFGIQGMTHITGGAFTKMKEFLGTNDAYLFRNHTLDPHPIFWELVRRGVGEEEMYKIFNCGIGFIIGVTPHVVSVCLKILRQLFSADVIGLVKPGTGSVHIQSMFSHREFIL
ncbi:MAG: AIR synthase-related protein [Candidatus Sungbacteria bacterium]|nr:AIR synthase-related protein [bacterium]MDZ4260471.1 AIR synthase-related protein [Candidatus Sungbacteria bacterium]